MGCKVFGRREGVPYFVNASAGIEDAVFCMVDGTATKERGVKVATAGATVGTGLIGVVQTGIWHGYYGTSADKYPQNADINVVSNGQVRVKILQTDSGQADYLDDGNLVMVGTGGKAQKYAAATITPTMIADYGDSEVSDLTIAATITEAAPTGTEIKAYVTEVIQELVAAEAVKSKAYIGEYVADYTGAAGSTVVGRCVGVPVNGVVCVELIGLGGIQQG